MKLATSLVLALSCLMTRAPDLRLVPVEGRVLERSFEVDRESATEHLADGRATSSSTLDHTTLVVTDEVRAVEDGRITGLSRTYDEVTFETSGSYEFEDEMKEDTVSRSSGMEGATVTFTWDEEQELYLPTSAEIDEEGVLEALVFDLEFSALLPNDEGREAEEGDQWVIELETFRSMLDPWQGLRWDSEVRFAGEDDGEEADIEEQVEEDGDVLATHGGTREVDGEQLTVIHLAGTVEIERVLEFSSEHESGSMSLYREATETRVLEGEALWNSEAGYLHSLDLVVRSSVESTTQNTFSSRGHDFDSESEAETESTTTFRVSVVELE